MSVIGNAHERIGRRSGGERDDGSRWYSRVYFVETDSDSDGVDTVLAAAGLPHRYYHYSTDSETNLTAVVTERVPSQIEGSKRDWEVDVRYDSKRDPSGTQNDENPLLWAPEISYDSDAFQAPAVGTLIEGVVDEGDNPYSGALLTSAGEAYDPPPLMDVNRPVLEIVRNEESFDPAIPVEYENAVNKDYFFGHQPRQAKIKSITTSGRRRATVNDVEVWYYPIRYIIQFKRETWDFELLDQGTVYWEGGKLKHFTTAEGFARVGLLGPVNAASSSTGGALGAGLDPNYMRYRVYKEKIFATLNLPQSMS